MNFGDILDQWEKNNSGAVSKRSEKRMHETGQNDKKRINPIDAWLRVNGVSDKDAQKPEDRLSLAENRRRLHAKKSDAVLDIHGLTSDEAWESLERFFKNAAGSGFEKVTVIHGKGNHSKGDAVLNSMVRRFIECCPNAGESGHEKSTNGGSGATWVLIKECKKL